MLRGINRQEIFLDDEDREHFLSSLVTVKRASGCRVLAYCLMTNHVHLLVRTVDEPISLVVKRLAVRYAGWFNRKYDRVGHLFQDRFRSRPVEDDAYLTTVLSYVWNNPVEAGIVGRPEQYRWSSRRLVGHANAMVDGDELLALVPAATLAELVDHPAPPPPPEAPRRGRRPRHTNHDAAHLLELACGATNVAEFQHLDAGVRRRTVLELRECGVSSRQIARLTGLSQTTVLRLGQNDSEGGWFSL
jgi:REP element-mobilizing transposase RayT